MPIGGMTPQMLAMQPQLMTHTSNMQQMETTEIEHLFKSICSQLDPELLQQTFQSAGLGQNLPGMPFGGGAPNMPRPPGQNQNNRGQGRGGRGGHYGENQRGGKKNNYVQY